MRAEPQDAPASEPSTVGHGSPDQARVLAMGHLHPGTLALRSIDGLRSIVLPLAFGLIADQKWLLAAAPVWFVVGMTFSLLRYVSFRYVLTEDELVTTEGIFSRQERRIPVNRIQDLNFESSLLRRMTGLVVVSVETASGQGAEAVLDSLGTRNAAQLREALHEVRGGWARPSEAEVDETVLYRSSAGELTLLGLTNNRIGAIVVGVFALFEVADQLGMGGTVIGAGSTVIDWILSLNSSLVPLVLGMLLFLFLVAGWVLAVIASFVKFHDFTLTLRDDVLQRRFGLITTRAQNLPRRRIQRVLLEQSLVRRILGLVVVRADSAGSGMDPNEEARSGRDIIAPTTQRRLGESLVPWLLENLEVEDLEYNRVSTRLVVRGFVGGAVSGLILTAATWAWLGLGAIVFSLVVPLWAGLLAWLAYQNFGYRELEDHVALRWGIFGRYRSFVPFTKVQAARLESGPLDRAFGLASLVVYVAGGSPTRLDYLPREEAERLERDIASRAAAHRFVW